MQHDFPLTTSKPVSLGIFKPPFFRHGSFNKEPAKFLVKSGIRHQTWRINKYVGHKYDIPAFSMNPHCKMDMAPPFMQNVMYQHGCRHFQTCEICRELTPEKRNQLANALLKVQVRGLGGGFKHFLFHPENRGNDPI